MSIERLIIASCTANHFCSCSFASPPEIQFLKRNCNPIGARIHFFKSTNQNDFEINVLGNQGAQSSSAKIQKKTL